MYFCFLLVERIDTYANQDIIKLHSYLICLHWLACDKLIVPKKYGGMGFKALAAFNVAMLGKQGWKLQTEHHTLVAKVFKARYFPRSNFLGSKLGHNPSFVWRSIF